MNDTSSAPGPDGELPPTLRWLKRLVTGLTLTLILGVITITAVLVTRLSRPAAPAFPENLALPAGVVPEAITRGDTWTGIVSKDGRIFIFDTNGALTQEITLNP